MCPSQSMEKQYWPRASPVGRDSMRDRLMPRVDELLEQLEQARPGWSSLWNTTTVLLSLPVGSLSGPGRDTRTNRVTARGVVPDVVGEHLQAEPLRGER